MKKKKTKNKQKVDDAKFLIHRRYACDNSVEKYVVMVNEFFGKIIR